MLTFVQATSGAQRGGASEPPRFVGLARASRAVAAAAGAGTERPGGVGAHRLVDEPQNLVSYHLRQLRDGGPRRRAAQFGRWSRHRTTRSISLAAERSCRPRAGRTASRTVAHAADTADRAAPRLARATSDACCSCARATAPAPRSPKRSSTELSDGTIDAVERGQSTRSRCIRNAVRVMRKRGDRHQWQPHEAPRRVRNAAIRRW